MDGTDEFLVVVEKARLYQVASASPEGVPSMAPLQPRLELGGGLHITVDAQKKLSERDNGDGIVHDSHGEAYLCVQSCQQQPRAGGTYVERQAVVRIAENTEMRVNPALEHTNCQFFLRQDKQGKPIFIPSRPMVKLKGGTRLSVSNTFKVSDKDPGDGTILGSGRQPFYLVVECLEVPSAEGLYVAKEDVLPGEL